MKKMSIQDIAKDLSLSRNTVSKALNNSESVAYETRQKIIQRAVEMGYKKLKPELKMEAETSALTKARNIVVLAHEEVADFWNRIIMGISEELGKNNYNLLFNFINKKDEDKLMLPSNILNSEVEGIITLSIFKKEYINKLLDCGIPIIFLDCQVNGFDNGMRSDVLLVEGENSVYELTKNLLKKGRKRIGFIGTVNYCKTINDRWLGFRRALKEENCTIEEELCLTGGIQHRFYVEEELIRCLEGIKIIPDAFVCSNDDIAINVIRYYKQQGYNIPKDIAVTGFDDKSDAVVIEPTLTTVHVYNEQVGVRLGQELIWRINNPDMPYEKVTINTKVIYRESFQI